MKLREKLSWSLAGVLGLFVIAATAGVVNGGSLDPTGPPAPTRKPLDDVLSSWNQQLAANDGATPCSSSRFQCILEDGQAVIDRETGLVWDLTAQNATFPYANVQTFCLVSQTGGRMGWRLPTVEELLSLVDPGPETGVPAGHPFSNVHPTDSYFTSTTTTSGFGRTASLDGGLGAFDLTDTEFSARYWCVRGGTGHNG